MAILIHPSYFPSISHGVAIANNEVVLEVEDNYQKQTYRNRTYIYSPNGRQMLSIPVRHSDGKGKQKYKDVKIDNSFPWQKQHWKSLETAYRTSPYFEFYEDEIAPLFHKKQDFLLDLNIATIALISDCLQLNLEYNKTRSYEITPPSEIVDLRNLIASKKEPDFEFEHYIQVFGDKHGFISNLSVLDLIFNEGPNALTYLESQSL